MKWNTSRRFIAELRRVGHRRRGSRYPAAKPPQSLGRGLAGRITIRSIRQQLSIFSSLHNTALFSSPGQKLGRFAYFLRVNWHQLCSRPLLEERPSCLEFAIVNSCKMKSRTKNIQFVLGNRLHVEKKKMLEQDRRVPLALSRRCAAWKVKESRHSMTGKIPFRPGKGRSTTTQSYLLPSFKTTNSQRSLPIQSKRKSLLVSSAVLKNGRTRTTYRGRKSKTFC